MTEYILDLIVDGVQTTVSLERVPTTLVLKLRKLDTVTTETLLATKVVL